MQHGRMHFAQFPKAESRLLNAGGRPGRNYGRVPRALDSRTKCNRAMRTGFALFAKLFKDRLERDPEAQAFSGREIGGDDNVLDFLVGHLVDVHLTRQPAA